MKRRMVTIDGNEAAAYVAYLTNEVIAIYPITPSSPMGELSDAWAAEGRQNLWGAIPIVQEMQSEGGAAGAIHGALQTGALATTFTASQGLLLMIPNMYKIAGELTPAVFHIAARTVATHALSIFGDHSDVMAARATGFAMMASNSIQEVMDFALIAQSATLQSRVPFLHFFDGFRTSHEVMKIEELALEDIRAMIDDEWVHAHRARALTPEHPVLRGSAQNPDVFFQAREGCNPFYLACPGIVQQTMDRFASVVGRQYRLFDYVGAPDAERVVIIMGSGAEAVQETVDYLTAQGEKVGVLKVRLFRPFSVEHFVHSMPPTVKAIAVLDRTKEPGTIGEPLYQDVVTGISEAHSEGKLPWSQLPKVVGGRYGLSSKEFTPAMVDGIFQELGESLPKNHFTVGIIDDITQTHLNYDPAFSIEPKSVFRGIFYGLGSDGTVSANKNSIKIIGEDTENYAQGYFVYDSKKAGSVTISHLRFGPKPIHSTYLITAANFVACHQFQFLERYDVLANAIPGATFLLNSPYGPDEIWDYLPREVQRDIIGKKLRFFTIDAIKVAAETGMGGRINTVMQTCFFAICGILPQDEAIEKIKYSIRKTYGSKGDVIVQKNFDAIDKTLANLHEVKIPDQVTSKISRPPTVASEAPDFVQHVTATIISGLGDSLPVSALPIDGTFPTGTAQWEKRNIALEIPVWEPEICIQCAKCALVCPHAAIRIKVFDPQFLRDVPSTFKTMDYKGQEFEGMKMSIQTAPEDCTGCGICVHVCPAKSKKEVRIKALNMAPQLPIREQERENYAFFLDLPEYDRRLVKVASIKGSQVLQPLFEYSGACSGCGETPYLKLLTQMFGDRLIVANATGCSSIYGGNLPTTPWSQTKDGRGPAWANSLFEDNAEFGLGFRLTLDLQTQQAKGLVERMAGQIGEELAGELIQSRQNDEADIHEQRLRVERLKTILRRLDNADARNLISLADYLVRKSVWIVGGDGWAYDIGYGGLDHVLASGRNVNVMVLDTEVYSNTGGQMSKATPLGAVAKFAAGGKTVAKKDLGRIMMGYGTIYIAQVAMGASDAQTVRAFAEAEAFDGPSLIIAYSHCIAHGINMRTGMDNQKAAVLAGHWPMYRYNPDLVKEGKNPLQLDYKKPKIKFEEYSYLENRYKMLTKTKPEEARRLLQQAQQDADNRWRLYEELAALDFSQPVVEHH
jgi:pyruvate-ferredoxin/flavodoxin oxidoreductase